MSKKMMLTSRLEPELIARLNATSAANKTTVSDTISFALDALEREQNATETIAEWSEKLNANIIALVETMKAFTGQMNLNFEMAKEMERVRLQAIVDLIKENEKAAQERFERLAKSSNKIGERINQ
jgi:rubrerythrin